MQMTHDRTESPIPADSSAMTVGLLVLERERDAWAAIRGFVYQVDQSIDRWLDLDEHGALQLEAGEDIDYVSGALSGDVAAIDRLLEQVKHRETNVTLRSTASREAVANFFEHRRLNPTVNLAFRFTTTARIGRERDTPLPGKMPGIHAWRGIQQLLFQGEEREVILDGIRHLLTGAKAPPEYPDAAWERFQSWLKTAPANDFEAFIKEFEWAVASTESPSLAKRIGERLKTLGHAVDDAAGQRIYEHLFVYVFRLLSSHGVKQLTRSDLVRAVGAGSAQDSFLVGQLHHLHARLSSQVETLERTVGVITTEIAEVVTGLASISARVLRTELGIPAGSTIIDIKRLAPPLTEPPEAPYSSPRSGTLNRLIPPNSPVPSVVALYGAQASGKSQLALRLARRLGERRVWIPFLGTAQDRAAERLVGAALAATGESTPTSEAWVELCDALVTKVDVVVLDDIPWFRPGDDFGTRLTVLMDAAARRSGHIITTSVGRLSALSAVVGHHGLLNELVPSLSVGEVIDVMRARGAADKVGMDTVAHLIHGVTFGHPVLVQAVAEYLGRQSWSVSDDTLHALFGKRYAHAVDDETISALLQSVSDSDTRMLLYRLTIADLEFERNDVDVVAAAPPPIDRSAERFSTVLGPWVEATGAGRYRVSQLVRTLGPVEVSAETQRVCHADLGRRILGRQQLSETDALSAIAHFSAAHEFDETAGVMIQGLHALMQAERVPSQVARLWSGLVVPQAARSPLRLQAFALQAVVAKKSGIDTAAALRGAEEILLDDAALPSWAVFAAGLTIAIAFAVDDAVIAAPFMARALSEWPNIPADMRDSLTAPRLSPSLGVHVLALLVGAGVHDAAGLTAWLDALEALPGDIRESALGSPLAREVADVVFGRIAMNEWNVPARERQWGAAANVLAEAATRARGINARALEGGATGCEISCRFEAGERIAAIVAGATASVNHLSGHPEAVFLVAKHVGLGAYDRGDRVIALEWLGIAARQEGGASATDRVHVHIRLSDVLMGADSAAAVAHAERAIDAARNDRPVFKELAELSEAVAPRGSEFSTLVIQTLAELSTAKWLSGDRIGSACTIGDVIDRLLNAPRDDDEWRALFARVGHASGYAVAVLETGNAPENADGSPYLPPYLGMFIRPADRAIAALYNPEKFHMLSIHAMMLAELAGDDERAVRWASRAADGLKSAGLWIAAVIPLERLVRDAIERDAYAEAFAYGEDMLTAFWTQRGTATEQVPLFSPIPAPPATNSIDIAADRRNFDAQVIDHVLLPTIIRLVTVYRGDPELARSLAADVRDICLHLRTELDGSELWDKAATVITDAFIAAVGARQLIVLGGELAADDERTLRGITYFVASFRPNTDLRDALHLQLNVAEYITSKLALGARTNERIAVPLLESSWRERFENARFRFQAPRLVETELQDAASLDPISRLKTVLKSIARGLEVSIQPGVRDWINK